MMQEAVVTTLESAWAWLVALGPNPLAWPAGLWLTVSVILVLIIVVLAARKAPAADAKRGEASQPELLISKGEIRQLESSTAQQLNLKISNLGQQPVQLLELSLKTELLPAPVAVEAVELIGPVDSIELEAVLPEAVIGEKGELEAYFYSPRQPRRIYCLVAQLSWEPWQERYRVLPLGQRCRLTRHLASERLAQLRRKAWQERQKQQQAPEAEPAALEQPEERRKLDWDFPTEF